MSRENSRAQVLIVAADLLVRWSLGQALTAAGARVTETTDGLAASAAVRRAPEGFDVAVLDVDLPDGPVLDLLAAIRRLSPATRIFLVTGFGTPELRDGARALGAEAVVDKPFDLDEIRRLVLGPAGGA